MNRSGTHMSPTRTMAVLLAGLCLWTLAGHARAGDIDIVGSVSYEITGDVVVLTADRIENNRVGGRSGTLSLELWAKTSPTSDTFFRLASARLGELNAGEFFFDIRQTASYRPPPAGTYFLSITVVEFPNENTALDSVALSKTLTIAGGGGAGDIALVGTVGYVIADGLVTLTADRIENNRAGGRSGTLRLELWAKSSPTSDTFFRLASARLGELDAGEFFFDVRQVVPYSPPPPGTYFLSMTVVEFPSENTALDTVSFSETLTIESTDPLDGLDPLGGFDLFDGSGGGGGMGLVMLGLGALALLRRHTRRPPRR